MKVQPLKSSSALAFLGFAILTVCHCAGGDFSESPRLRGRGIPLFNGRDLTGFYTWLVDTHYADPRHVFSVTNGLLRLSGDGLGYLATRTEHHQYQLVVEYRWGKTNWSWGDRIGKARDSGLFLHASGPDGNSDDGHGAFMAAIECNIFQGATGDFLLIRGHDASGGLIAPQLTVETAPEADADGWCYWKPGGGRRQFKRWGRVNWIDKDRRWADKLDFRGRSDVEHLPGEWNRIEVQCRDRSIEVRLNGTLVNRATEVFPSSGKILLQCEGSEIFFRRVELYPAE